MSRRYSRIKNALTYQQSLENYIAYLQNAATRTPNIGGGKARDPNQVLFVQPFTLQLGANDRLQVSASRTAWTEYTAAFGTHTTTSAGTGNVSFKIRGFRPAKVNIVTGRSTANRTVATSKVTKAKYLSYGGTSRSVPFGKAAATDTEELVFEVIRSEIAVPDSGILCYMVPEKA